MMKTIFTLATASALALAGPLACGDDDGDAGTDTSQTGAPDATTTTPPDGTSTTPLDTTTTFPDIDTPDGSIKALRAAGAATGCDPNSIVTINPAVSLTQVVVTSPKYDAFTPEDGATGEPLDGWFVADQDGGVFSGATLVFPRSDEISLQPGDVLDVEGEHVEFFCFTQIKVTSHTVGTAVDAPTPTLVDATEVGREANEGRLLSVEGVSVSDTIAGGVYRVEPGGFIVGRFGFDFFLGMDEGTTYDVTGVLVWSFGEWRLAPRRGSDLVNTDGGEQTTIAAIQQSDASQDCDPDSIENGDEDIEIEGVVTAGPYDVNATLVGYFVSDGTEQSYSAINVTISASEPQVVGPGDEVRVQGDHIEFFCMSQVGASAITKIGDGEVPAPVALASDLAPGELEPWEGVLVEFSDVTVTEDPDGDRNQVDTDAGVMLDGSGSSIMGSDLEKPAVGTTYATLRGILRFSFGAWRIMPRDADDLVLAAE